MPSGGGPQRVLDGAARQDDDISFRESSMRPTLDARFERPAARRALEAEGLLGYAYAT